MNKIDCLSLPPHDVGQLMANTKVIKKCLEFENNAIGHMTFVGQPTLSAGQIYNLLYLCVFCTILTE